MINKIILRLWSARKEFVKYFIIGITAFILDIGSLFVLKKIVGLSAVVAVTIYQPPIILGVFYLNKHWSFRAGGITHRQMIKFVSLAAINYAISVIWIYLIHDRAGVQYILARTVNIALAVAWNFLLYKYWVYRPDQEKSREVLKQAN